VPVNPHVADVGMGHAGIVLGLQVPCLARNNTDWHRLLEICAPAGTLILDEDGLYDPANFNDRLLLGLKGTMSEALWRGKTSPSQRKQQPHQPQRAQCDANCLSRG
jgi:DNA invertase Pin-like site-specific DNA recombinase